MNPPRNTIENSSRNQTPEDGLHSEYNTVPHVNRLRKQHALNFFSAARHEFVIVPLLPHDFDLSELLFRRNLSAGQVRDLTIKNQRVRGVAYSEHENLIPLSHILNSMILMDKGQAQIARSFQIVTDSLRAIERAGTPLPGVCDLDGVAISRQMGRAEFLPPFQSDERQTAADLFSRIGEDVLNRAQTNKEISILEACLQQALR